MRQCVNCKKPSYQGKNGKWYCNEHFPDKEKLVVRNKKTVTEAYKLPFKWTGGR